MPKSQSISALNFGTELPKYIFWKQNFEVFYFKDTEYGNISNPPHWHHYYELMLIMKGSVAVASNGTRYPIPEGCVVVVPPGMIHSTVIYSDMKVYERLLFHWTEDFSKVLSAITQYDFSKQYSTFSVIRCNVTQTATLRLLLEQIMEEEQLSDQYSAMILRSNIIELLLRCARQINSTEKDSLKSDTSHIVTQVTAYINDHFHETNLCLKDISEIFFISSGHLSKVFRTYTGCTVYQYIIQRRLLNAREQLISGASVMDACLNSGFSDYTCFLKSFKQSFHQTPREYINCIKANPDSLLISG